MIRNRVPPRDRLRAVALVKSGRSMRSVRQELGMDMKTIIGYCRAAGLPPSRQHVRYEQKERAHAIAMVAQGASYRAAGRAVGADVHCIREWCLKAGVRSSHRRWIHADAKGAA